ncbi:hypothetical protein [Providencia huashanensis]|uniref:Tail fiber protein n=1 Tax=Providencia huashanensis TaxID=3037798 RepID=A0ABT9AMM4_9GAMM|nr:MULTISPECIES: hypothetical protein [unclassified Providencia]MDO7829450.1 hypothetical protein [Providencia sp. CRE-138-0026]MDO7855527.1 hypothetical protein [Providencia sp. CRE-138-0111]
MYGLDNASGVNVMPKLAPVSSATPLWFTEGGAGLAASYPGQDWFNMIQAELLGILTAAGVKPEKGKLTQLAGAIKNIVNSAGFQPSGDYAIKNEVNTELGKKLDKTAIVQTVGSSTVSVISQQGATREFAKRSSADFLTTGEQTLIARDGTGRQYFELGDGLKLLIAAPKTGMSALAIITSDDSGTLYDLRIPKISGTVAIQGDSFGLNQEWSDLTSSRAVNTSYVNSSTKPIQVSISIRASTATDAGFSFYVGTTKIAEDSGVTHIWDHTISAIIPPNKSYKLDVTGSVQIKKWGELR